MVSPRSAVRPFAGWPYVCAAALAIAALGAVGWWRASTLREQALLRMSGPAGAGASTTETAVESWLGERQQDALVAAKVAGDFERLFVVADSARANPELTLARDRLAGTLTALQRGEGPYGAWAVNKEGAVVARAFGSERLPESAQLAVAETMRDDTPRIVGPSCEAFGRLSLFFTAPVHAQRGSPSVAEGSRLGAIIVSVDPVAHLFPLVTTAPSGTQSAQSVLVARDGDDLVVLTPMRFPPARAMEFRVPASRAPEAALRSIAGTQRWMRTRDFRGVPVVAAMRSIDQTGWGVIRFIDEEEALDFFYRAQFRFEALLALALIGSVAIGVFTRDHRQRVARLRTQLVEAELRSLRLQLEPHFLFNSLNTVAELVHEDPQLADRMITRLSDLLRLTVEGTGTQAVTLRQELHFLEAYLDIERLRFRERLSVEMDIAPDTLDALVPALILQPIVENSIRHGLALQAAGGRITVSSTRANGYLELAVRDNGCGLQRGGARERVGLSNTRARLEQLYGAAYRFELRNHEAGGAIATIAIPFRRAEPGALLKVVSD
jgi:Histidine kinase